MLVISEDFVSFLTTVTLSLLMKLMQLNNLMYLSLESFCDVLMNSVKLYSLKDVFTEITLHIKEINLITKFPKKFALIFDDTEP